MVSAGADRKCTAKVAIPVYRTDLSPTERLSLERCMDVLGRHPVVLFQPESLDTSALLTAYPGLATERFADGYFAGRDGYNRLMLSAAFYQRFIETDYLLIHQLDAFVFRDELTQWCLRGYDYIGAPWLAPHSFTEKIGERLKPRATRQRHQRKYGRVGNGGFSLRRVAPFIRVATRHEDAIQAHLQLDAGYRSAVYEDMFWGTRAPVLEPGFSIPGQSEALEFAIDHRPWAALRLNQGQLPFGCHGFEKRRVRRFWEPLIEAALAGD